MSPAGRLVEIAGRLVGDEDGGIGRERARQRHALLFAAGQFGRIVMDALRQSDGGKLALGAFERVGNAGELERHGDVFQRRHGRDQMESLKHDADILAAKARQRVLVEPLQLLAVDLHRAGIRPLQPGHHHEERRLAGARRAQQANSLAAPYMKVDVAQDMNAGGAAAERQVDPAEHDGVAGERKSRNVVHAF